ncbi:MAG: hypothetical protein IKA98_02100 [Candidatus Methanomethylophilaceae archaeon]|nr:hypothetical protein [Candidatus Methanomethylophilaceae archaeon]
MEKTSDEKIEVRRRVMIACVTTEVTKIVEPARQLDIERIHLINYIVKTDPSDKERAVRQNLYEEFYKRNVELLSEKKIEIVPHRDVKIFDFHECFRTIYEILKEEEKKGSIIHVNISAGPPEYAAAVTIAAMMLEGVSIFSVATPFDGHTMSFTEQRNHMLYKGKLVGTAFKVHNPKIIDHITLNTPDEPMLKALKVFASIPEKERSNANVIRKLIQYRLWKYSRGVEGTSIELEKNGKLAEQYNKDDYDRLRNKEAVLYQRGYIDFWKKQEKWIEKSEIYGKKYKLTSKGQRYLEIFCPDIVFDLSKKTASSTQR